MDAEALLAAERACVTSALPVLARLLPLIWPTAAPEGAAHRAEPPRLHGWEGSLGPATEDEDDKSIEGRSIASPPSLIVVLRCVSATADHAARRVSDAAATVALGTGLRQLVGLCG